MSTTQTRKLEISLPENAYNVLKEMALMKDQSAEQYAREMIYCLMESDLSDCTGDIDSRIANYLCKKYNYDPEAWREEASS